jgi:hypothetical protein
MAITQVGKVVLVFDASAASERAGDAEPLDAAGRR